MQDLTSPRVASIRRTRWLFSPEYAPTEFGKMVTLQESEGGLVTGYCVQPNRMADSEEWEPALRRHQELFGRAPYMAAADQGFSSA